MSYHQISPAIVTMHAGDYVFCGLREEKVDTVQRHLIKRQEMQNNSQVSIAQRRRRNLP